jgi:hypothetical protein
LRIRSCALALSLLFGAACSSSSSTATTSGGDAFVDAGQEKTSADASLGDGTADAPLEVAPDAGDAADAADAVDPRTAILGTLDGSCGKIAAHLTETAPSAEWDSITFVAGESYVRASLSPDGQRMYDTANAGGSSTESEVMSLEVLHYCDGAALLHTETEISYAPPDDAGANTISDYEVDIGGKKVGVSVTRAYKPSSLTYTDAEVQALLEKKLEGVNRSSVRVSSADRWVKQILHVWVATDAAKQAVERVLPNISATLRADTIVLVTRTIGGGFIYCNPDPALGSECPP